MYILLMVKTIKLKNGKLHTYELGGGGWIQHIFSMQKQTN